MKYLLICVFAIALSCAWANNCYNPNKPTIQVLTRWVTFNTSFMRIGQQYYYIPEHKSTWFGALHTCRQIGGELAHIESAEQMHDISSYLIGKGYKSDWFWISGNDLAVTSTFMSVTTGMPLTFLNWSSGQPDFAGVEQCIHLWLIDGTFKMNNRGCKEQAFYICQKSNIDHLDVTC